MASSVQDRVKDAGYTPGIKDLPAVLDLFASDDDDLARSAERAVLRIETRYLARTLEGTLARAKEATRPARGRLTKLVGRLAQSADDVAAAPAVRRAELAAGLVVSGGRESVSATAVAFSSLIAGVLAGASSITAVAEARGPVVV